MRKRIFSILLMGVCCVAAFAQTNNSEYEKELDRAVQLQNQSQMMVETIKPQMDMLVESGQIHSDAVDGICNDIVNLMLPKLTERFRELCRENYSLEELKVLNAFMASPVGQKNMRLMAKISEESFKIVSSPEVLEKMMEIIKKYSLE